MTTSCASSSRSSATGTTRSRSGRSTATSSYFDDTRGLTPRGPKQPARPDAQGFEFPKQPALPDAQGFGIPEAAGSAGWFSIAPRRLAGRDGHRPGLQEPEPPRQPAGRQRLHQQCDHDRQRHHARVDLAGETPSPAITPTSAPAPPPRPTGPAQKASSLRVQPARLSGTAHASTVSGLATSSSTASTASAGSRFSPTPRTGCSRRGPRTRTA